jgi:hypothetical protein
MLMPHPAAVPPAAGVGGRRCRGSLRWGCLDEQDLVVIDGRMKLPHKSEPLQNNEPDLELPRGSVHSRISDSAHHRLHVDARNGNPAPASGLAVDSACVLEDVSDRVQVDAPLHLREGEPNHEGERRHAARPTCPSIRNAPLSGNAWQSRKYGWLTLTLQIERGT